MAGCLNLGLSYLTTAVLTSCLSGSAVVLTSYSPSLTLRIVFTVLTNGRLKIRKIVFSETLHNRFTQPFQRQDLNSFIYYLFNTFFLERNIHRRYNFLPFCRSHKLRTPGEEIAFTARSIISSQNHKFLK